MHLKAWTDLEPLVKVARFWEISLKSSVLTAAILQECQTCEDPELYGILANILLCSEAPTESGQSRLSAG